MYSSRIKSIFYTIFFFALTLTASTAYADDTEIYFSATGSGSNAAAVRPNVLLILDSSGSMGWTTGTAPQTRMEVMREAMVDIINGMEDVNVGLMRFTSGSGGPVLFPIAYIDDPAENVVSEPSASATTVTYTITNGNNDAVETDDDGGGGVASDPVTLTGLSLEIPATAQVNGAGTVNLEVSSSSDDAYECNNQINRTNWAWLWSGCNLYQGFRFTNVNIPKNADIDNTRLTLTVRNSHNGVSNPTATIQAEDVDDATTFSTSNYDISTRTLTSASYNGWSVSGTADGTVTQSPDLSAGANQNNLFNGVIRELVTRTGWEPGNSIALVVRSNVSGRQYYDYDNGSGANRQAKLDITYSGGTTVNAQEQVVGLHFPTFDIPQGATITSAKLTVAAKTDHTGGGGAWEIFAEKPADGDSDAFAASNGDLSGRATTTDSLVWSVPDMTADTTYTTCDTGTCSGDTLIDVVQEAVNDTNWCGGSSFSLLIKQNTTGNRKIHSFESNSSLAPKLEVTYDASTGGCYQRTETAQISANYDDVEEKSDGSIQRTSGDLDMSGKLVGLRFVGIDVPKNATILSATLEVRSDGIYDNNPNPSVEIWGINEDNTVQFPSGTPDYLTDIAKVDKNIDWNLGDFTSDNQKVTSPDIKDIVQDIVNRSGWASGNAMGFVLDEDNKNRAVESHDDNPNQAPKLSITYRSTAATATSVTTVRDRLIELVNDIPTSGATPVTETLYEAARYWRGDSVIYGKSRAGSSSTRISHPGSYCTAAGSCGGANESDSSYTPATDAYGVYTPTGCDTSNLTDYDCRNRAITGTPDYISPFSSTLTCQSNYQVLLTDGEANSNNIENLGDVSFISGNSACQTTGTNRGTFSDGEECSVDIVEYLNDNDQSSTLANDQIVKTYTIGFNTTGLTNATNFLKDVAVAGDGTFSEATTADSLVSVFTAILNDVKSDPTSFVAPSLATNAFNRLLSRDEVYFGLFTPSYNRSWVGNAKKYNICVSSGGDDEDTTTTADNCTLGNILDANKVDAIDSVTSKFKDSAKSVWSDVIDGRETVKGGAGGEITDYTVQKFFTEATSTGTAPASGTSLLKTVNSGYQIDTATWDDTDTAHIRTLVCPTPSTTAGSDCEDRMLWILGKIEDPDADSDTSATTRWSMNDVLHSSPAVITYGGSDSDSDGVVDTFFDRIVVGTNDGALRFINGTTGKQEWEFFPQAMLGNIKNHFNNSEADHLYGLDTTPTIRVNDVDGDGTIEPTDGDFVHVIIAMRRGGNFIYALDVTPSSTLTNNTTAVNPKFLWRIEGGTSGFERLGQTWSQPRLATIGITSGSTTVPTDVLIFGGGYDDAVDDGFGTTNTGGSDNMGNAVYIIDPSNGSKLFSVSGACASCGGSQIVHSDMDFSIPSRITILDTDGDGFDDRLYFGDTGGQIWRVDIADDVRNSGSASGREGSTIVGKLASISTSGTAADERQFFEPPAVVQVLDSIYSDAANGEYDYVMIGTGGRPNPLEKAVSNRFYAFRDKFIDTMPDTDNNNLADSGYPQSTGGAISHSNSGNLVDITTTFLDGSNSAHKSALGWYYDFDSSGTDGEKVLAAPTAIAGTVFFTTYLPEVSNADACSANVGSGSALNFNILTTKASLDWDEDGTLEDIADRRKALGGGIPSDVVPIFTKEGVVGIVGIEGGAAQLGTLTGLPRYRTYWYEEQ